MTSQTVTTTGDGTFIVPDSVISLTIEAWGGGGGGTSSASADGGGGAGYSFAIVPVRSGQTVFFHVGVGGAGSAAPASATDGEDSWVNPSANSKPVSNGVVGGGGKGASASGGTSAGGVGSIGTTNFTGGIGQLGTGGNSTGGGGGGGAGSAGNGSDGIAGGAGGAGGSPDGGKGAAGVGTGPAAVGTQPGGGGAGEWNNVTGGSNGGAGQVRFTWILGTTLTNKPAKAFTRKHYYNELEKIRSEKQSERDELDGLDEKGRADRDYETAKAESDEYENNLGVRNYAKAMDAKDKLAKARKARDHHYFMDVVRKAWADHEAKKKK